jgi:hypothetical protein
MRSVSLRSFIVLELKRSGKQQTEGFMAAKKKTASKKGAAKKKTAGRKKAGGRKKK